MPGSKTSYHHGDLRRVLTARAAELLEREGLEALTLRAVAAAAGVSHNAPYRHFADRAALLASVAAQGYAELASAFRDAAGAPNTICALGEAYLRFARAQPEMYRLMFTSELIRQGKVDPDLRATSAETYASLRAVVAAELGDEDRAGAVSALVWSQLHGLAMLLVDRRLQGWMREGVDDAQLVAAYAAALPRAAANLRDALQDGVDTD